MELDDTSIQPFGASRGINYFSVLILDGRFGYFVDAR